MVFDAGTNGVSSLTIPLATSTPVHCCTVFRDTPTALATWSYTSSCPVIDAMYWMKTVNLSLSLMLVFCDTSLSR